MVRHTPPVFLAAALLFSGVPALLAQQASPAAGAPALSLEEMTERAQTAGYDVREAELAFEQARLQYEQIRAKSRASVGASASLSHADTFEVNSAGSGDSAVGTNTGQACP